MKSQFIVDDITFVCIQKNIKTLRLSIHPPNGTVTISAPICLDTEAIHSFVISKLDWIRKHRERIRAQKWSAPPTYISGEVHFFLGKKYILKVIERNSISEIVIVSDRMELYVRTKTSRSKRRFILEEWYRLQLKTIIPEYIQYYEEKMNVYVDEWGVKKMKTRWGSCNIRLKKISLNLELAKKPLQCIENVVVHEMVHLLERTHNHRFKQLMDTFLPPWRQYKDALNRPPGCDV
jgi:predicted metal-dependent hydrolase